MIGSMIKVFTVSGFCIQTILVLPVPKMQVQILQRQFIHDRFVVQIVKTVIATLQSHFWLVIIHPNHRPTSGSNHTGK